MAKLPVVSLSLERDSYNSHPTAKLDVISNAEDDIVVLKIDDESREIYVKRSQLQHAIAQ